MRTTQDQTEVVTMQAANGARQTVLIDAEGEERFEVTRDPQGNYTATEDEQDSSTELWSLFGDQLQTMHAALHGMGAGLTDRGTPAQAATADNASFQTTPDPVAAPYSTVKSCNEGISNGRKNGIWLTHDLSQLSAAFSHAQCAAYANSCGSNAQVTGHGTHYYNYFGFVTLCLFTTDA